MFWVQRSEIHGLKIPLQQAAGNALAIAVQELVLLVLFVSLAEWVG
jgi:hypothetical protein